MKLNETNRSVLAKELPWLMEWLPKSASEVNFQVIDSRVLDLEIGSELGEMGISYAARTLRLFTRTGELIGTVGMRNASGWFEKFLNGSTVTFDESVAGAMVRLAPESVEAFYVTELRHGKMTIHKTPKGHRNIYLWLAVKAREELQQIEAFVADI